MCSWQARVFPMSLLVDGWTQRQGLDMAMTLMRLEATTIATIARQKLRTNKHLPHLWWKHVETLDVTII